MCRQTPSGFVLPEQPVADGRPHDKWLPKEVRRQYNLSWWVPLGVLDAGVMVNRLSFFVITIYITVFCVNRGYRPGW